MTRTQWAILGALGIAVLCLYCVGTLVVLQTLSAPSVAPDSVALHAETPTVLLMSPTPLATSTRTATPTASPTATLVLAPPPTPASTTVAGTRAPLAPNVTPGATATRHATVPSAGPIVTARNKTQAAATYRIEFQMTVTGNLPDLPPAWQAAQGAPIISVTAAISGKDSHIKLQGLFTMLVTGDPTKPLEILTVGGKTYLHGPLPLLGAPENKWYISSGQAQFSIDVNESTPNLPNDTTIDWNAFKKTTIEVLDGRRCDVYVGDKNTTMQLFDAIVTGIVQQQDVLSNITNATTKFWICDDGYLHQLLMNIEGSPPDQPSEKVGSQIRMHIWDFNANIKLTPPANAVPLQGSTFNFGFATPTRAK